MGVPVSAHERILCTPFSTYGAAAWPFEAKHGVLKPLDRSEATLGSGSYALAVRLRHEYKPNQRRAVRYIPVLKIIVSETGEVSYHVHEDVVG